MSSALKVLKNRNFLFLWIGQLISQFGDCLAAMALIGLVYTNQTGNLNTSSVAYAKLFFFIIIPVFIIGPIAGVYIDRWNRKYVMITCDIIRGLLVMSIPIFWIFTQNMLLVYLIVFLIYSSTRFFLPSKLAIIPEIVSEDKLLAANSLTTVTRSIAFIFSFVLAGVLVKWVGWQISFYIDAATYIISAVLISMINLTNVIKELKEDISIAKDVFKEVIKKNVFSELKKAVLYLWQDREVLFITKMFFVLMSGVGAVSILLIVSIQQIFGTATWHLSFFGSFLALGVLLGSLIYGRCGQGFSKIRMIFISFVFSGLFLTFFSGLISSFNNVIGAGVAALILGMVSSPIIIGLYTLLHEKVPNDLRGRIFSTMEMVIHGGFLIFMFLSAWLNGYIEEMYLIVGTGVIFAIWGTIGLLRLPVDIKVRT